MGENERCSEKRKKTIISEQNVLRIVEILVGGLRIQYNHQRSISPSFD